MVPDEAGVIADVGDPYQLDAPLVAALDGIKPGTRSLAPAPAPAPMATAHKAVPPTGSMPALTSGEDASSVPATAAVGDTVSEAAENGTPPAPDQQLASVAPTQPVEQKVAIPGAFPRSQLPPFIHRFATDLQRRGNGEIGTKPSFKPCSPKDGFGRKRSSLPNPILQWTQRMADCGSGGFWKAIAIAPVSLQSQLSQRGCCFEKCAEVVRARHSEPNRTSAG